MIFVTVGTQLSFRRLLSAVDYWGENNKNEKIFAQIGDDDSDYQNITSCKFLDNAEYEEYIFKSNLIVSHAGIGTILTAMSRGLPVIVMPRRYSLGEHRNDHQIATAQWLTNVPGVYVAWSETELHSLLDRRADLKVASQLDDVAPVEMLENLRKFING